MTITPLKKPGTALLRIEQPQAETPMTREDEFFAYLTRERQRLHDKLGELDRAERIYRASRGMKPIEREEVPKTIDDMITILLQEVHPRGLTVHEMHAVIRQRWRPRFHRPSLSPRLSTLRKKGIVIKSGHQWSLTRSD